MLGRKDSSGTRRIFSRFTTPGYIGSTSKFPGSKRIEMELPEGMLELDAPLSKEEKDLQQKKSD